jgi:isoleucyl-tRNA synthetase
MFPRVPKVPDFPALELEVARFWQEASVFERSISIRIGAPEFTFYEGPPTANGRPGLHHVWARVYKDLFCRFHTMRGKLVKRHAGWDTHGLPVEVEVEKRLGFSGKDEIERYGVAAFVDACRESVRSYVDDWVRMTHRIGYFVDLEDAYWTLTSSYVESVWWHLSELYHKGLLFEDVKVAPYCTRCGTSLSSHELGQPDVYRDETDLSIYVRLPIVGPAPGGAKALAIWTTTPWTLTANVGVAVNPEMTYVVVDGLVIAVDRADAAVGEGALARATAMFRGSDLVGVRYERPFDLVSAPEGVDAWRVVSAPWVTAQEGTGLVHLAPAFGTDDWTIARREGLPTINPVGPDGLFHHAGFLNGQHAKKVDQQLIDALNRAGLLIRVMPYTHSYPHCWRCQTPLIYWGKPSWYVATQTNKDALADANETVSWQPEAIKHGRFGEWLENNVDWALSRDRYWGTPLPIWRCLNGHITCIASLLELSEYTGSDMTDIEPHRPAIDKVTFPCATCGEIATRVEAVIDAWFDSGSMPAAQWGFPHVAGSSERLRIPADFVCEAIDQTRGWFYSLLAVNTLVFGLAPYRNVLALGHIVDADGKKMSKSLGNVIDPWTILDTSGADPLRWWMFHQGSPWSSTRVSTEAIDASTADVLMRLWNTWSFFATYASVNGFNPADPRIPDGSDRCIFDRWIASRLAGTVLRVTEALEAYSPVYATDAIAEFVDDLSNWFVRCNRRRFWRTDPSLDQVDSLAAHATLHEALVTTALLLAPFCPFLAERMWRELTGAGPVDSVHLATWPASKSNAHDERLESEMAFTRYLVSLGRAARSESGVKVRQPLRCALVVLPPNSPQLLKAIVAEELNVDAVDVTTELSDVVTYEIVPNFRSLGPRLGKAAKNVRAALQLVDPVTIVDTLHRGEELPVEIDGETHLLTSSDVEIRVRGRAGYALSREGVAAVAIDLEIDEELRVRGLVRDLIRQIQALRRSMNFEMSDRIDVVLSGVEDLAEKGTEIGTEVLARSVEFGVAGDKAVPLELDGRRDAKVAIARVDA